MMISILTATALLFTTTKAASELNINKVHLVDYSDKNTWLFRTNLPIINHTFAYDTLLTYMQQRAAESNVSFPDTKAVRLVDISLLNPSEYFDELVEEDFFIDNPEKGELVQWMIVGSLVDPNGLIEQDRRD